MPAWGNLSERKKQTNTAHGSLSTGLTLGVSGWINKTETQVKNFLSD